MNSLGLPMQSTTPVVSYVLKNGNHPNGRHSISAAKTNVSTKSTARVITSICARWGFRSHQTQDPARFILGASNSKHQTHCTRDKHERERLERLERSRYASLQVTSVETSHTPRSRQDSKSASMYGRNTPSRLWKPVNLRTILPTPRKQNDPIGPARSPPHSPLPPVVVFRDIILHLKDFLRLQIDLLHPLFHVVLAPREQEPRHLPCRPVDEKAERPFRFIG